MASELVEDVFVWVAAYVHGHRVWRSHGVRGDKVHLTLPRAGDGCEWLQHHGRVVPSGEGAEPDFGNHNGEVEIVALVRLRPGVTWSILELLDWGMAAQWRYYLRPVDAFFPCVAEVWSAAGEHPCVAHLRIRSSGRSRGVAAQFLQQGVGIDLGRHGLFRNVDGCLDLPLISREGCVTSARQILVGRAQALETVLLVRPLCNLLVHRQLSHLMLLSRWAASVNLWPHWPCKVWSQRLSGRHCDVSQQVVGLSDIRLLSLDLRTWARRIVGGGDIAPSIDEPSDDQQLLEGHLRVHCLDMLRSSASHCFWHKWGDVAM